jgi:MFS family permease
VRHDLLLLALALPVGVGLGFAYASSIYYSLHGSGEHGKYSGIHEAVLGAGNFALPLAGGALADALGDLRVPYALAGLAALVAVGVQEAAYRMSATRSSNRSMR